MNTNKKQISDYIDSIAEELLALSREIHTNPETLFEEHKACAFIIKVLKNHGFEVQEKYCGIDTAFRATKKGKADGPKIAFMAEYDALPEIGHGCGHNVIATCSTGAVIALGELIGQYDGEVSIIGTPAEEGGGGKVILLREGGFKDIQYGLMIHPSSGRSLIGRGGRAATTVIVEFTGKAAHSASPAHGINALNAVISLFNHIDMLRPTFHVNDNVNGIIHNGGSAPNSIPDYAACKFSLRSATLIELEQLVQKVKGAIKCSELLTGAIASIHVGELSAERYSNMPMCEALKSNMALLGEEMGYPDPNAMLGSSDVGNVSIELPCIHDYLYIAPGDVNSHSAQYTEASGSPRADEICLKGAKGLAMTGLDILENAVLREEIAAYFAKQIPEVYKKTK